MERIKCQLTGINNAARHSARPFFGCFPRWDGRVDSSTPSKKRHKADFGTTSVDGPGDTQRLSRTRSIENTTLTCN